MEVVISTSGGPTSSHGRTLRPWMQDSGKVLLDRTIWLDSRGKRWIQSPPDLWQTYVVMWPPSWRSRDLGRSWRSVREAIYTRFTNYLNHQMSCPTVSAYCSLTCVMCLPTPWLVAMASKCVDGQETPRRLVSVVRRPREPSSTIVITHANSAAFCRSWVINTAVHLSLYHSDI